MSESNLKGAALVKLYASDATACAVLDHFASRQQDRSEITVDRMFELLAAEGHVVTRADIINTFRDFEEVGAGKFVVGRKGHPSRFLRSVNLIELGQMAKAEVAAPSSPEPRIAPPVQAVSAKPDVIAHRYVLRQDFTVTLQLPADFTQPEALRLSDYVKTLPFSV